MDNLLHHLKDVYKNTWQLYVKTLNGTIPFSAIIAVLTTVVPSTFLFSGNLKDGLPVTFMLFFIAVYFVNLIPTAAIFHQIFSIGHGQKPTFLQSLHFAFTKFNTLVVATLLFILWGVGAIFVGGLLGTVGVALTHNNLFSLLVLIPCFLLFLAFYFYKPLIILFHQNPSQSLKLSFHLVKNHWGTLLISLLIPLIGVYIFNFAASYITIHFFMALEDMTSSAAHAVSIANEIVASIVGILTVPFFATLSLILLNRACEITASVED